jgi:hypothetical protein
MTTNISIINVPYLGDLYRFFVTPTGDLLAIHFFANMSTSHKELDEEDVPHQVIQLFEMKYMS